MHAAIWHAMSNLTTRQGSDLRQQTSKAPSKAQEDCLWGVPGAHPAAGAPNPLFQQRSGEEWSGVSGGGRAAPSTLKLERLL